MVLSLGDFESIVSYDGRELDLPDDVRKLTVYGSFGFPPIDFVTRRGYRQHGETEVDYFLKPRQFQIQYVETGELSRQQYWDARSTLIDLLRPNRNGPLTFTLTQPSGAKRSIVARADPGPVFPGSAEDNSWIIDEPIVFTAFDPVWFDPDTTQIASVSSLATQLVFPITFPITFGAVGYNFSVPLVYTGTWVSYPRLVLTGPYTRVTIYNSVTDINIDLIVPIGPGEQRIIDLTPGNQSITDASGVSKFGDLSPISNLVEFNIRPDPEVPEGIQKIIAQFTDGTVNSLFAMTYYTRYIGL